MTLLVLLEKTELRDIQENRDFLCKELYVAGKKSNLSNENDSIDIKILEGKLSNGTGKEKVVILVCSEQVKPNMGQYLVEFKKDVIDIFGKVGITLGKDTLEVQLRTEPYNIDTLTKKVEEADNKSKTESNTNNDEFDYEKKSKQYIPVNPVYSFERVILPEDVSEKIDEAIGILECENKVFNEWGLYEIQPYPSTSLSFYGPSGTGKTMAAEAIAHKLGKKILKVSYADVESKYHGEGPKMVKSIFLAAKNQDAVLFFDEADSLLSKRLTSVSQGSEQAINSMRSQLLICLEEFRGIVIFATNLIVNYDQAFLTRLISVEFKNPDSETRKRIWDVHIRPLDDGNKHKLKIPLSDDVDTKALAEKYEFVGREIRNAVVSACVSTAMAGRNEVTQDDLMKACERIIEEKKALDESRSYTKGNDIIKKIIEEKVKTEKVVQNISEQLKG